MSNARAIATVTMSLKEVLRENALWTVPGSEVVTLRPQEAEKLPNDSPRINLYLYQIVPNVAFRTADLPTRRSDGSVIQKPQSAWDLHYLLSFYGNETTADDQLLLGSTVDVLHAQPFLSREMIRTTISNSPYLVESNLAEQVESIKFSPLILNLEELSKVWSVFFQTPYALSISYQASVVLIEADEVPRPVLPVLQRNIYPVTFRQPTIERILSQIAEDQPILPNQPILTGHRLILEGRQLQGDTTRIRVGQVELAQNLTVSDTRIGFVIPPTVKTGVRGVQVAHVMKISTPERDYRYVESNVAAFVLRPTITGVITLSNVQENGRVITVATVPVSPEIAPTPRVVLLLNQRPGANPSADLAAYQFTAPAVTTECSSIAIPIDRIPAGEYLVRLQVDGAESLLTVDPDPESPTFNQYNGPTVTIP